jgi:hypothetical protein
VRHQVMRDLPLDSVHHDCRRRWAAKPTTAHAVGVGAGSSSSGMPPHYPSPIVRNGTMIVRCLTVTGYLSANQYEQCAAVSCHVSSSQPNGLTRFRSDFCRNLRRQCVGNRVSVCSGLSGYGRNIGVVARLNCDLGTSVRKHAGPFSNYRPGRLAVRRHVAHHVVHLEGKTGGAAGIGRADRQSGERGTKRL